MTVTINDQGTTSYDLYDFARTHVEFATFHPEHRFDELRLELRLNGPSAVVCCLITASKALGQFEIDAIGEDAFEAIARAADMLAEDLDRRVERLARTQRACQKRSGLTMRMPLAAAAPAPSPAATHWTANH
jgi:hypothetical protein